MLHLIWKYEAKRIRIDEVIKHFVNLVNKIDWVIMWHRDKSHDNLIGQS